MFLEHEAWHLCPVKPNFSLLKVSVSRMMHTLIYEYIVYKCIQMKNYLCK